MLHRQHDIILQPTGRRSRKTRAEQAHKIEQRVAHDNNELERRAVDIETCGIKVKDRELDTEEHSTSVRLVVGRWIGEQGKVTDGGVGRCEVQVQSAVGHGAFGR